MRTLTKMVMTGVIGLAAMSQPLKAATIESFFGDYRNLAYNGFENHYSRDFFAPSIDVEVSNKNFLRDGKTLRTLNFNFEVPIEQDSNTINLHFLFLEAFLDVSTTKETPDGIELSYQGPVFRVIEHQGQTLCWIKQFTRLRHLSENKIEIFHEEATTAPCADGSHLIQAEKVILPH